MKKEFWRGYLYALIQKYGAFAKVAKVIEAEFDQRERERMFRFYFRSCN